MKMILRSAMLTFVFFAATAQAQTLAEMGQAGEVAGTMTGNAVAPVAAAPAAVAPVVAPPAANSLLKPTPNLMPAMQQEKQSLFFTHNQLIALLRAKQGYMAPKAALVQSETPPDPGPRVITLSGIVYQSPNDWTVWLNGERVTPRNIPERVMGIKVQADLIHLRWMDIGRQRIVNIVLRPHQQFALDTDTIYNGG